MGSRLPTDARSAYHYTGSEFGDFRIGSETPLARVQRVGEPTISLSYLD
jgi:hypothetical protein